MRQTPTKCFVLENETEMFQRSLTHKTDSYTAEQGRESYERGKRLLHPPKGQYCLIFHYML